MYKKLFTRMPPQRLSDVGLPDLVLWGRRTDIKSSIVVDEGCCGCGCGGVVVVGGITIISIHSSSRWSVVVG